MWETGVSCNVVHFLALDDLDRNFALQYPHTYQPLQQKKCAAKRIVRNIELQQYVVGHLQPPLFWPVL